MGVTFPLFLFLSWVTTDTIPFPLFHDFDPGQTDCRPLVASFFYPAFTAFFFLTNFFTLPSAPPHAPFVSLRPLSSLRQPDLAALFPNILFAVSAFGCRLEGGLPLPLVTLTSSSRPLREPSQFNCYGMTPSGAG